MAPKPEIKPHPPVPKPEPARKLPKEEPKPKPRGRKPGSEEEVGGGMSTSPGQLSGDTFPGILRTTRRGWYYTT
jgi:hypothetical protein